MWVISIVVVDHVGEVVGRVAVRFEQHEIFQIDVLEGRSRRESDRRHAGLALARHGEADDVLLAGGELVRRALRRGIARQWRS